jgi:hypothetical protein
MELSLGAVPPQDSGRSRQEGLVQCHMITAAQTSHDDQDKQSILSLLTTHHNVCHSGPASKLGCSGDLKLLHRKGTCPHVRCVTSHPKQAAPPARFQMCPVF